MEKTISIRQLGLMSFVSMIALKLTILPSLMHKDVGVDSIFIIIIYCSIDFMVFLFAYNLLKKNQHTTFYNYLCKKVGKIIAKIIFILLFFFYLFKMQFLLQGGFVFSKEVVFQEAYFWFFAFILLTVSGSLYLFKVRSFARTIEFFFPFIIFLFVVFLAIPFFTATMYDLRPFFETNTNKFFYNTLQYVLISGDFIFMLLLMGKIDFKNNKKDFTKLLTKVLLAIFMLIAFYGIFSSVFKYTAFLHSNAIADIVQFIPTPSILGNFDLLTISFIQIMFALQGGLFTTMMCESMAGIVKYKKNKISKNKKWILFICYTILLASEYFIFKTFESLVIFAKTYLCYPTLIILLLPFILFLMEFFGRKKGGKNEKNI